MISAKHNVAQSILSLAFLAMWFVPCWAQLPEEDPLIRKVDSVNLEYSVIRERRMSKSRPGKAAKKGSIDILKDRSGKTLWEKHLPGEIEGVELVNGKPNVIVKIYGSNRRVRFDGQGNVLRQGDKFPLQIKLKDEFSGWTGARNPLQVVDNKTAKVLWELTEEDVPLDCISEDGQYFVVFKPIITYKKETSERVSQVQKFIRDNEEAIKQGKIAEPSYDYSEKDVEKSEYFLSLYNVNHEILWRKQIKQLEQFTAPCCPVIESKNNETYIILTEQDPKDVNKRVRRKFNLIGEEVTKEAKVN